MDTLLILLVRNEQDEEKRMNGGKGKKISEKKRIESEKVDMTLVRK